MEEFRAQLSKGSIQVAYRALLSFMMDLRKYFANRFGASTVSALYQGYLDMTYFGLFLPSFAQHDLKIAIVFNYEAFRFEAWLVGRNRKVQRKYWELFKDFQWPQYRVVTPAAGIDSIVECDLVTEFDLSAPDTMTSRIVEITLGFIEELERYLLKHEPSGEPAQGDQESPDTGPD
jgi:hypothetical protein